MTEIQQVLIPANGLSLSGALYLPDGPPQPRPAAVLCHGFAGQTAPALAKMLATAGIVALTFKFRGYNGQPAAPITVDPVAQAREAMLAVGFVSDLDCVDVERVAIVGSSLGGSVAMIATASDKRIAACVAMCPVVNGAQWLRGLAASDDDWSTTTSIAAAPGISAVSITRYDLVPIPEDMRHYLPPDTPMHFTSQTVRELVKINLTDQIDGIGDTPLLLIHAEDDRVVAKAQSDSLARAMQGRADYDEPLTGDHFISANPEIQERITRWLTSRLVDSSEGTESV